VSNVFWFFIPLYCLIQHVCDDTQNSYLTAMNRVRYMSYMSKLRELMDLSLVDIAVWGRTQINIIKGVFFIIVFSGSAVQRGLWPPRSRGFVITHNDAPQSVGLLWTSDQPVAETSTWQHTTHTTYKHPCPRWDSKPRSQQARGHKPKPYTARPLGPAKKGVCCFIIMQCF
jgi:hypothetical protein